MYKTLLVTQTREPPGGTTGLDTTWTGTRRMRWPGLLIRNIRLGPGQPRDRRGKVAESSSCFERSQPVSSEHVEGHSTAVAVHDINHDRFPVVVIDIR
jgi:hypothetical protein